MSGRNVGGRARAPVLLVSVGFVVANATVAFAQQAGRSSVAPGRSEQRFERPAAPTAPRPRVKPVAPGTKLEIAGKPGTFVLSAVGIEGATVYGPAELAKLYQPLLAQCSFALFSTTLAAFKLSKI